MKVELPIADLSNQALLEETMRLTTDARCTTAKLIAALAEIDARKLWADEGCSSLYTYCTQALRFSEHEAYLRMEAARAVRRYPVVLELLATGELSLTNLSLLRSYLTAENHEALLAAARNKSKREVERQVAALQGDSPRASVTRVTPVSSNRFHLSFEVTDTAYEKLQRATDLLRHAVPNGDLGEIFDRALTSLLRDLERRRLAAADCPRGDRSSKSGSRYIPASVRRAVWRRDCGCCAFVGPHGRCTETAFLEFHHVVPFATGGESTVENIQLRCRAHNQREAELFFGLPTHDFVRDTGAEYGLLGPDLVVDLAVRIQADARPRFARYW